jgi:hypothetical protein
VSLDEDDVRAIIIGIFDVNRRLQRRADDVQAIREEVVGEGDDGEEA